MIAEILCCINLSVPGWSSGEINSNDRMFAVDNVLQIAQLNALITLLIGKLSSGDRQKIMTICTIEVHNRDVVGKLITQKVENSQAFTWLSQLRHRWDDKEKDCFANICDAQFRYSHEYLGNTPRLVITPLTDR